MPAELIQLTKPFHKTPDTARVQKLRDEVAELNAFFAKHTLTHPTVRHLGWVRKFHLAHNLQDYRWNKGGRLYACPPGATSYQNMSEKIRLDMLIDGEEVVED